VMIQRRWRALYVARKTRTRLSLLFDQDPACINGLRALVLMPQDEARLAKWSLAMTDGKPVLLQNLTSAQKSSWFVLFRQIAPRLLESVAGHVLSGHSESHLRILNILLTPDNKRNVGDALRQSVTLYLMERGFYGILFRAITCIPVNQKASPLLTPLLTSPLRTFSISPTSSSFLRCLHFTFTHVLTIPLLPKRTPIESLTQLSTDLMLALKNLHHLSPFSATITSISSQSTVHLIANLVDFFLPRFRYPELPLLSYNSCLCLLGLLVASIPERILGTPDNFMILQNKSWIHYSQDAADIIKIDHRSRKQVLALLSTSQISIFLNHPHAAASIALGNYLSDLYFYWPAQCDQVFETILSNGVYALVGVLYRTGVHNSPLGKTAVTHPLIDPANASHWPPLLFLAELYIRLSLNMSDDMFFSSTKHPLRMEELQAFLRQLTYIVYCLDRLNLRGIAPVLGNGATLRLEKVSTKLKTCLHTLYARQ
ncbi:hypothetical protein C8J57DRAFT_1680958, partial [Mycena rebaudengoi]